MEKKTFSLLFLKYILSVNKIEKGNFNNLWTYIERKMRELERERERQREGNVLNYNTKKIWIDDFFWMHRKEKSK